MQFAARIALCVNDFDLELWQVMEETRILGVEEKEPTAGSTYLH